MEKIFNHLVLPSRLPPAKETETQTENIEENLLERLIQACGTVEKLTGSKFTETWTSLRHSLRICQHIHSCHLEKASLVEAFSELDKSKLLILHINAQNAGLLIRCNVK